MSQPEPSTVASLDLARYLGVWYEIARLPMRHEPPDYTDISATYTLEDDGAIQVRNRALDGRGQLQESVGRATPVEGSGHAKLKVNFLPEGLRWIPFTSGDYWVLRLDPEYRTALVGTPDRDHLWLLHRAPVMDEPTREAYLATAQAQGYDLSKLIITSHTGRATA
jgi:apolipoprotein D and lipocalin family protein